MKNMAMNFGISPKSMDYTKFLILARSRTGSNYLRGLLNSHQRVIVFGEIFKNQEAIEWGMTGYPQDEQTLILFQNDPAKFLDLAVFRAYPRGTEAVGFKLFYYHAHDTALEPIWAYLKLRTDIKVIHLKRRNILKTHLSRKRAVLTDKWENLDGSEAKERPITLDYEECLQDFVQTRAWEQEYDQYFQDHPFLAVTYEDLASNKEVELRRIEDFLAIEHKPLTPETFKQSRKPLYETIANYDELRTRFEGTPWESFFNEVE